jgi:hypothetical protein
LQLLPEQFAQLIQEAEFIALRVAFAHVPGAAVIL